MDGWEFNDLTCIGERVTKHEASIKQTEWKDKCVLREREETYSSIMDIISLLWGNFHSLYYIITYREDGVNLLEQMQREVFLSLCLSFIISTIISFFYWVAKFNVN